MAVKTCMLSVDCSQGEPSAHREDSLHRVSNSRPGLMIDVGSMHLNLVGATIEQLEGLASVINQFCQEYRGAENQADADQQTEEAELAAGRTVENRASGVRGVTFPSPDGKRLMIQIDNGAICDHNDAHWFYVS